MRLPALVLAAALAIAATTGVAGTASADPDPAKHAERACTSDDPTVAACFAEVLTKKGATPASATPPPGALTPAQLQAAYHLPAGAGQGRTVAVVVAYSNPNLEQDLATYRSQFGLPPCTSTSGCLRVIDQDGGTKLPHFDTHWAVETALDVDAVSAACPACRILVVEAKSDKIDNLSAAVQQAAAQPGVVSINNSYGFGDLPDTTYGAAYDHPGIAVVAATGDAGYQGSTFPSSSSHVVAAGGTSLAPAAGTDRGWSETAWSGAGSGCSAVNVALAAASPFDTGCDHRASADISAAADPAAGGLAVYYPTSAKSSTWATVGGTSEASPIIAAAYAMAADAGAPDAANARPYAHPDQLFDVTSGSTGTCAVAQLCGARSGWDGPTGLGTPNGLGAF